MMNNEERNELITLENNTYQLDNCIANDLILLEKEAKEIKKKQDEIKAAILTAMEEKNIKQIKDEVLGMTITYTAPTQKEKFNTKKFKEDNPSIYDDYIEFTDVKSSLRITIK